MADYNSKTMARKKVREAQQKVRDERELRERANIEDMATFLCRAPGWPVSISGKPIG